MVQNGVIVGICLRHQLLASIDCPLLLHGDSSKASGYMNRIAFFLDKIFKKFGLSGKSIIPFIVGTGCSVPAS
jgi:ferrous iron transport protein B